MAKYTSDINLIKGAADAYKDWSNVPGMYAGLDKLTKAGLDMVEKAEKDQQAAELKAENANKAAKKKTDAQNDRWWKVAGGVYESAGAFQHDIEYKSTLADLEELRLDYAAAVESGSAEERSDVMIRFNNIKSEVDEFVALRKAWTDPEFGLSEAMRGTEVAGGDDGRDLDFMIGLMDEKYEVSIIEGVKTYTVGGVSKTMEDIKEMTVEKNNLPFAAYAEKVANAYKIQNWNKAGVKNEIKTNIVPGTIKGLRAFVRDKDFDGGVGFIDLLNKPAAKEGGKSNRQLIEAEILGSLNLKEQFDDDENGIISDLEWQEFTNAIIDPYHKTWEKTDGTHDKELWQEMATTIVVEQLANGVENQYNKSEKAKAAKKAEEQNQGGPTGRNLPGIGFQTWASMQLTYDKINSVTGIISGPQGTIFEAQPDGTWRMRGTNELWTKSKLRDLFGYTHLPEFENTEAENKAIQAAFDLQNPPEEIEEVKVPIARVYKHSGVQANMITPETMFGNVTFSDLFTGDIDDDDVEYILKQAYPNLKITTPVHWKEKIRIAGIAYQTNNMDDMKRLMDYLNGDKVQSVLKEDPTNKDFNSNKEE